MKKVRLVRMAKKLVFLTSGCISLRGINVSMRFEETPANISPSQMPRESVLYNLRRNISRKVYALGDSIILTAQFHPFSHGKGVNVIKDSRQKIRASASNPKKIRDVRARKSLDMSTVPGRSSELCQCRSEASQRLRYLFRK